MQTDKNDYVNCPPHGKKKKKRNPLMMAFNLML